MLKTAYLAAKLVFNIRERTQWEALGGEKDMCFLQTRGESWNQNFPSHQLGRGGEKKGEKHNKTVALTVHLQEPEVDGFGVLLGRRGFSADFKVRL